MAKIACTAHLNNIGPLNPLEYAGHTVGEVIDAVAADYPKLKSYVLDDQGRVRKHVAIFVNGQLQPRDKVLALNVNENEEIFVMQALSGG